jgi:hypothetical protein
MPKRAATAGIKVDEDKIARKVKRETDQEEGREFRG